MADGIRGYPGRRLVFLVGLGLPFPIKVFWAPVVDRIRFPGYWSIGSTSELDIARPIGIAAGLFGLSLFDPSENLRGVALLALLVAFSSATQDISIDAYRIEAAEMDRQAAMAAAYFRLSSGVAGCGCRCAPFCRIQHMERELRDHGRTGIDWRDYDLHCWGNPGT
ncbi:MAG: hypothetical protein CM1200mP9_00940 [Gammaproteobacteria bacterium]|nr:MAG: hypothetical protein CM1200mP9_00940 [Gammaproteobacteria bacterium]